MCGIVGFTSETKDINKIDKFTADISHRGPDSSNYKIYKVGNQYLHLGSARLAIRGDEREDMPMEDKFGNSIIYNGEIFDVNYLKPYLEKSNYISDTRVLLELLSKDTSNISLVNGMFAFIFFEKKSGKIYFSRDKLGIKPLYYVIDEKNNITFSSEINSLLKFSNSTHTIDSDQLNKLFYFGGLTQNSDIIKNFKILETGELFSFDIKNKKINLEKSFQNFNNYDLSNAKFENLITEVLDDHLVADNQVDILLSGGIDSSLLAYVSKMKLNKRLNHYSLIFDNESYTEESSILATAQKLALESRVFEFKTSDINIYINDAVKNMNSLVIDYSFIPSFFLSKKTSNFTKAVISGDGADELFGGYEWYRGLKYFQIMPYSLKQFLEKVIKLIDFPIERYGYLNFYTKLEYFFKYIVKDPYVQMIIWQSNLSMFSKKDVETIAKEISNYISISKTKNDNYRNIDLNFFLYSNVLPKIDVASMANGLEIRPPFLDDRLVQYSVENSTNKVGFLKTKLFLRNYIKGTDIEFLNKTKKHGFGFPLVDWLNNTGLTQIKNYYNEGHLLVDEHNNKHVGDLLNSNKVTPNISRELWGYYILTKWAEVNSLRLS
jgi:asparagine synthase (glutamine-hydrolysing)